MKSILLTVVAIAALAACASLAEAHGPVRRTPLRPFRGPVPVRDFRAPRGFGGHVDRGGVNVQFDRFGNVRVFRGR